MDGILGLYDGLGVVAGIVAWAIIKLLDKRAKTPIFGSIFVLFISGILFIWPFIELFFTGFLYYFGGNIQQLRTLSLNIQNAYVGCLLALSILAILQDMVIPYIRKHHYS